MQMAPRLTFPSTLTLAGRVLCTLLVVIHQAHSIVITTDSSPICQQVQGQCQSTCLGKSYIFDCNSGGTFGSPTSNCQCVSTAQQPFDGAATLQLASYPTDPAACRGLTWLYECAKTLQVQVVANNMQATAATTLIPQKTASALMTPQGALASLTALPSRDKCQEPLQGIVTQPNAALVSVPTYPVGQMMTKGNTTVYLQLGGQTSACIATYTLVTGQILNLGREPPPAAPAAANATAPAESGAGSVSSSTSTLLAAATAIISLLGLML
eukprot:jgi/Chrzof1/12231/Cz06g26120.t1